jgi:Pyruvate/2-oxoglutarate dehydrogenase complex, dihydrolipoamide dehydrogenase (E3) component, and related enzymes
MSKELAVDICIIGAGSGGLSVAAAASRMGARVALVEKSRMGGDCLNTGCVPSKSLLAAGHVAQSALEAAQFGVNLDLLETDWLVVHRHIHEVIAAIAPNDSQERFESLGVQVIRAKASFIDRSTIKAGDQRVHAKFFVLATGSSPFVPPIEGLQDVPYFTNETIFDNSESIEHLLVVGGGPIGMEMAQAHCRLGAKTTVMEMARLLPKDDPELTRVVIRNMSKEGIQFHEGGRNLKLKKTSNGIAAGCETKDGKQYVEGSHLLIATGRRANVKGLNLEAAGVRYSERGIEVDGRLRTSNRRIFAIGDVAGPYQFTHMASYQAGIAIRNILFRLPAKVDYSAVPWVTYTDPELAHVGMSEADAHARGINTRILRCPFTENDRAQAERRAEGLVKVVTNKRGEILGASIVGLHAGELIQPWVLAISQHMKIGAMAGMIAPYPTLAEVNKRIAGGFYASTLYGERMQKLVRFLLRLP